MARCPDCNKFVGLEEVEPEVSSIDVDADTVRCEVRIANACADCGTELTEATLEMSAEFEMPEGWRDEVVECGNCKGQVPVHNTPDWKPCELCAGLGELRPHDNAKFEVDQSSCESTMRTEGKGRGTRTFYGATVVAEVTHPDFPDWSADVTMEDDVQASSMDTLG